MKKTRLLLLLALLMTAATGAWGMQIYISYPSWPTGTNVNGDGNLVLEMEASDSFENMKAKIEDKSGLNPTYMKLYFNSVEMANDETLNAKGVTSNSVLTLVYTLYTVSLKDGVKDADKWTISPNPAPEGSPVTIQYTGRLKVKGVKATSDEKPAEATPALSITSPSVGQVIGSDGKNYAYGSLPSGVTAVAKICYISGSNGLALALTDEEGQKDWSTANETCAAHTPAFTGGTWKLASLDEWENMITTAGNQTDLRDGFSSVGGTNMEENCYWSSSEVDSESACLYYFGNGQGYSIDDYKDYGYYVRACLAFTVEQSAKPAATVTTAPTGAAIVGRLNTNSTALVSGGVADGGTLMYAVTTTNTKPTSTAGFSDAVPTAKDITASGKVYVWYYVKGDDTHSDSEIAGPVSVTIAEEITWNSTNVFNSDHWQDEIGAWESGSLTYEGITISKPGDGLSSFYPYDVSMQRGKLDCYGEDGDSFTFTAPSGKKFCKIEIINNEGFTFDDYGDWTQPEVEKAVWSGTAASTVTLGTVDAFADNLNSIAFYLVNAE